MNNTDNIDNEYTEVMNYTCLNMKHADILTYRPILVPILV